MRQVRKLSTQETSPSTVGERNIANMTREQIRDLEYIMGDEKIRSLAPMLSRPGIRLHGCDEADAIEVAWRVIEATKENGLVMLLCEHRHTLERVVDALGCHAPLEVRRRYDIKYAGGPRVTAVPYNIVGRATCGVSPDAVVIIDRFYRAPIDV